MSRNTQRIVYTALGLATAGLAAGLWLWDSGLLRQTPPPLPAPAPATTPTAPPAPEARTPPPPVDTLWQRYQAMQRSLPDADRASPHVALPDSNAPVAAAPDANANVESQRAQRAQAREQARAERQQRFDALIAARNEVMHTLQRVDPEDTDAVITAIEVFDRRLTDAGVDSPLNMEALRQQLRGVGRLNALNAELMREIERGGAMRPQRVQQLARELKALKAQMQQPIIDPSYLQLELYDVDR